MAIKMWFDFEGKYWSVLTAQNDEIALSWVEQRERKGWRLVKTLDIDMSNLTRYVNDGRVRLYHPGF